ncbi:MAG: flagellar biosynthetic protein FliO [Deltaproteobacteria bacterium]|nr:flagellar biosynthetic protein FliO [Deltaproteobacteria bacterium]
MVPDTLGSITRMVSSLAIVIGTILLVTVLFRRLTACGTPLGNKFKLIRTITSMPISPKKSIAMVDVAGEIIVIGITSQQISMLYKIESDEALGRIHAIETPKETVKSFREHLEGLMSRRFRTEKKWKRSMGELDERL